MQGSSVVKVQNPQGIPPWMSDLGLDVQRVLEDVHRCSRLVQLGAPLWVSNGLQESRQLNFQLAKSVFRFLQNTEGMFLS